MMKTTKSELVRGSGIVVVMDALGTRNLSIGECEKFLRDRSRLLDEAMHRWEQVRYHDPKSGNSSRVVPHLLAFGDTLVVSLEMRAFSNKKHGSVSFPTGFAEADLILYGIWIRNIAVVLSYLIREGLSRLMAFRGALSIGEFILDNHTSSILGPAVNDAVGWYEMVEGIGVVLTPHAALAIECVKTIEGQEFPEREEDPSFVLSEVYIKGDAKKQMYMLNWPGAYFYDGGKALTVSEARSRFLGHLFHLPKPIGTERKYELALDFFSEIVENHPPQHVLGTNK
jgi:hypothetical protein